MKTKRLLLAMATSAVLFVATPMAAHAGDYGTTPNNVVPTPPAQVLGENLSTGTSGTSTPSGTLPVTGGDIAGMTIIGLGAVATGTVLVRRSRRRDGTATA